jgi:hypothetical protein
MSFTKLSATGSGAEGAIGQLTRLTSWLRSVNQSSPSEPRWDRDKNEDGDLQLDTVPLQQQQLACCAAPQGAGDLQQQQ